MNYSSIYGTYLNFSESYCKTLCRQKLTMYLYLLSTVDILSFCKSKYVLTALLFPSDFTIWYLYFSLIIFHFHIWFFGLLNISSSFESKTYRYKHDLLIFLLIRCMSMHDFKHCNHFIRRFKESIKVWQLGYISACIMDRGDLSELGNS